MNNYMPTNWTTWTNETYNHPKLYQEESENLNRYITTNELEAIIKKVPTNKILGPEGFIGEFYQTSKKN